MVENAATGGLDALRIDRGRRRDGRWKRRLISILVLLVVVVLGIAVALGRRTPEVAVTQVREARPGEQVTVLSAAGYVASRRRSVIAPKVAGRLKELLVQEGQAIREGQVVARLDDEDARVALQQAEAQARVARSRLSSAQANLVKARDDERRARRLFQGGATAAADYQHARDALNVAVAEERAAVAQQSAAEEAVQASRLLLQHTVVHAPFNATVVKKLADEGAVLAPATINQMNVGGIIEVVDLNALEVEADVSEDQLRNIHTGQPALIFLDAYPNRVYRGAVGTVRPAVDRSKATATVKVEFREQPKGVLPDMAAKVSFLSKDVPPAELDGRAGRLRVPASAVVQRGGRQVVMAVQGGRLHADPVEEGPRVGNEVVLKEGPAPGTPIVASPGNQLRSGMRVRVKSG